MLILIGLAQGGANEGMGSLVLLPVLLGAMSGVTTIGAFKGGWGPFLSLGLCGTDRAMTVFLDEFGAFTDLRNRGLREGVEEVVGLNQEGGGGGLASSLGPLRVLSCQPRGEGKGASLTRNNGQGKKGG